MMSPVVVVLTITLLLGLAPVTTDLYLPALPALQRALQASAGQAQLTLSVLIICFGFGQLVCGPLADRLGRRPVLLAGMALYTLASLGCALAASIDTLVAWRGVQGAALAAPVTCGRALVRDLYAPTAGARVMSRAFGGLGLIAMLGPLSGGLLVQAFGWPSTLLATALFGAATLGFAALKFDETLPVGSRHGLHPRQLLRSWREVLESPVFRAWTLLLCAAWGGLFFLLAGTPFVLIDTLGTPQVAYGAILSAGALAYIVGTLLCRRLLRRHGLRGTVERGAWFSLAAGVALAGLAVAGVHTVWAVVLPQWLFALGYGILQPCAQAGVVAPFPDKAGTAASLSGFAMMGTAFVVGIGLGSAPADPLLPMALGVGVSSLAVAWVAWTLVQRDGEVPNSPGLLRR